MTFSLVTFRADGEVALGALVQPAAVDRSEAAPGGAGTVVAPPELKRWATMLDLLDNWTSTAAAVVAALDLGDAPPVAGA